MAYYSKPFRKAENRKTAWRLSNELPIEGKPKDIVLNSANGTFKFLLQSVSSEN